MTGTEPQGPLAIDPLDLARRLPGSVVPDAVPDAAPDAVIVIDRASGAILAVTEETLALFGYPRDALIGKPITVLVPAGLGAADGTPAVGGKLPRFSESPDHRLDALVMRNGGTEFPAQIRCTAANVGGTAVLLTTVRDLREREQREARYAALFEASGVAALVCDPGTGRVLYANAAALRKYGYSRDEFLAMSIDELRMPDVSGAFPPSVRAHGASTPLGAGYWHHRRKDGRVFQVQLSVETIPYHGGLALLVQAREPERDVAQAAGSDRERQLAEAQALAHIGSWEWRIPTGHITWSDELYRICGLPLRSPVTLRSFMNLVHPDDRPLVHRSIGAMRTRGQPPTTYEFRLVRPDGDVRRVLNRYSVEFAPDGQPLRRVGTTLDVTDRWRAEQALVDSERRHRELVENSSDLVTVFDADQIVQYVSPSVKQMLGYSPSELLGRCVFDFLKPEDLLSVRDTIARAIATPGSAGSVECRWRHRDGSWRVLESIGQARESAPGVHVFVVNSRDVTDRKAIEQRQQALLLELSSARRVAESATQAKSDFLANMSHEIRTPMNAILGLTELLLDTEVSPDQRRYLQMVSDSGEVLLTLLNDILDLSKIEASHIELEEIVFDLPALAHATASLFAVSALERQLELMVDVAPEVPRYLRGDPTRLRQVLTNLISNAVKFTPEGEVEVSVGVVETSAGSAKLRFAVRDTGIGIAADKLDRIFKEFSQLDASTTRRYGGTGLGLTIAKRLVGLMGGQMAVTSQVGQGSEFSFTVTLPVETGPAPYTVAVPVRLAGARVLVVDDNDTNRRIVREILAPAGASIDEAPNAATALAVLERALAEGRPFPVALLDSQMPDHDGWTLAADIRRHAGLATTHLLMLTSAGEKGDAAKCRALGIEGYLVKPVSRSELVEAVGMILAGNGAAGAVVTRHVMTEARARLRILLAEDNVVNQEVAAEMLRKRGHDITVVDNGLRAVAAIESGKFDVVLMDIHMPEMDGLAATAAIRQLPGFAGLPIIALTADALTGERDRCLAAGMSEYLAKPFKSHDLFAVVERWGAPPAAPGPRPEHAGGTVTHLVASVVPPDDQPPVDVEGFRTSMREAGAEGAVEKILDTFTADAPKRQAALLTAFESRIAADIRSAAHAYKSAAGAIGAHALAALMLSIEVAGKEGRIDDARALSAESQKLTDAVVSYLHGRRPRESPHA
ncbi:MAG TPA: PAS domain S-box protein [Gemmatimonadaceae bacterium]|nr:PAS domain S-box protein [Gemmatimonadaceae bacterium]